MLRLFCGLILLCPLVSGAPVSDAVNERIPVSRAELEAHWNIDCLSIWSGLRALKSRLTREDQCQIDPETRRTLELCVFVHQSPGGVESGACPDYRAALMAVDTADPVDQCTVLAAHLADQPPCRRLLPAD